jgi:hypothetical protein
MPDMLVKLYQLPPLEPEIAGIAAQGVIIRRALAPERHRVIPWISEQFAPGWASEAEVAFGHQPIACYIAVREQELLGFGCYDTTAKGYFGPTGVHESARGLGIGKALLLICLHNLWWDGYAYGIIGAAGPTGFYAKTVGAIEIEDSPPGKTIYRGMLK